MKNKSIPWSNRITNIQGNVLEALAKYKFLTLSQMLQLDIGTVQYKYLWKQVASLRDRKRGLIDRRNFNTEDRLGRVEDMYFLTKHGLWVLMQEFQYREEDVRMPIGKTIANKDYYHRKYTIDFQIELNQWANQSGVHVPFFSTYFDKVGNNRIGKNLTTLTKIDFEGKDYFIPDAAFKLSSSDRNRLFLLEVHNGADTLRLLKQLHKHAYALVRKFAHTKFSYDLDKSYSILLVFEHQTTKNAFIKRMVKTGRSFSKVQQYFLCKSLEELKELDFGEGWLTIFGENRQLVS